MNVALKQLQDGDQEQDGEPEQCEVTRKRKATKPTKKKNKENPL